MFLSRGTFHVDRGPCHILHFFLYSMLRFVFYSTYIYKGFYTMSVFYPGTAKYLVPGTLVTQKTVLDDAANTAPRRQH